MLLTTVQTVSCKAHKLICTGEFATTLTFVVVAAKQPLPAGQMAGVGVGVLTSWTVGETRPVTHAATSDWMSVSRPLFQVARRPAWGGPGSCEWTSTAICIPLLATVPLLCRSRHGHWRGKYPCQTQCSIILLVGTCRSAVSKRWQRGEQVLWLFSNDSAATGQVDEEGPLKVHQLLLLLGLSV